MKKFLGLVLMIGLLVGLSASAYALTFDFTGAGGAAASYNFSNGGVNVIATGTMSALLVQVFQDSLGIGVQAPIDAFPKQTDGGGDPTDVHEFETLILTFDHLVKVNSADFTRLGAANSPGGGDHLKLLVDGSILVSNTLLPGGAPFDGGAGSLSFTSYSPNARTGYQFAFTVPSTTDDYTLKNLNVDVVPEPGSMALLGIGLFGLARRFRKR